MKKLVTLFLILIFSGLSSAQVQESLTYQFVVRNATDILVTNQTVGLRLSILSGSSTGTPVYIETLTPTTNLNGLASIQIGDGTIVSGDFSTIDWAAAVYYIKTETDPSGGTSYLIETVEEITSAPFSLYSNVAQFADTADYTTLTNLPTIINQTQIDKLDLITVTNAIDLDQLSSDVDANTDKDAFPGFGTTPGTALEGDNFIWTKSNSDAFYTQGNVGIGVPTTSTFGGAKLLVGGGIKYSGIPATLTEPGMLYYDHTDGNGKFHFIDQLGGNNILGGSDWTLVNGDNTTSTNVIIQSSLGLGMDAVSGQEFGYESLILKENNLRILFDDSDDSSGTMPYNDWQIEINESANGGESHFAIKDVTNGTQPFNIVANAPDNSFFMASNGNVGIGLNNPSTSLEVNGTIKATSFIGDGSGLSGIATGTGGISNIDDTTIAADTNADNLGEIVFQTQNTSRMVITNAGNVGIGTTTPTAKLEVVGTAKFNSIQTNSLLNIVSLNYSVIDNADDVSVNIEIDASNKSMFRISNGIAQTITGFNSGIIGQQFTIFNTGLGVKTISHNTGTQPILLPNNASIDLELNESASFIFDGTSWYCTSLNN